MTGIVTSHDPCRKLGIPSENRTFEFASLSEHQLERLKLTVPTALELELERDLTQDTGATDLSPERRDWD